MTSAATSKAAAGRESEPGTEGRQLLLLIVAALFVGGVLLARFWTPGEDGKQALDLMRELGAEVQPRPLTPRELQFPLELPPPEAGHPITTSPLSAHMAEGEVVLLHFWASWCPPCIDELPQLWALVQAMRGKPFRLVAVSYDDAWAEADGVLQRTIGHARPKFGTWLRDPGGNTADPQSLLRTSLGTEKLPETYVLVDGQVLGRFIANQPWMSPKMLRLFDVLAEGR